MASSSPGLGTDAAGPSGALHLSPVPHPHLPPVYDLRCAGQPGIVPHLTRATLLLPDQDLDSRVMVPASLALAAYLAGLDDVCGTWPLLHIPSADWHALLNFIAWRVLPRAKLAACKEDPSTAWQLLVHRGVEYKPRDGCLLPSRGKALCREAREARLPRPCPALSGADAAQQEQLPVQREADRAFWLARANCAQTKDERWELAFSFRREAEARRAVWARGSWPARATTSTCTGWCAGGWLPVSLWSRRRCPGWTPCLRATPACSSPASAGGTWPGARLHSWPSSTTRARCSAASCAARMLGRQPGSPAHATPCDL